MSPGGDSYDCLVSPPTDPTEAVVASLVGLVSPALSVPNPPQKASSRHVFSLVASDWTLRRQSPDYGALQVKPRSWQHLQHRRTQTQACSQPTVSRPTLAEQNAAEEHRYKDSPRSKSKQRTSRKQI